MKLTIPSETPDYAVTVSPALFSFSIEQDRWTDWAGTTAPNEFTYNVLNNLRDITGTAPWVRIGADSEDHTFFDPSVEVHLSFCDLIYLILMIILVFKCDISSIFQYCAVS
jgi:hypothetical protein